MDELAPQFQSFLLEETIASILADYALSAGDTSAVAVAEDAAATANLIRMLIKRDVFEIVDPRSVVIEVESAGTSVTALEILEKLAEEAPEVEEILAQWSPAEAA